MNSFLNKLKKTFFLDDNEKFFNKSLAKNNKKLKINENENIILFNAAENYYDLCFAYLLSKEKTYSRNKILFYIPFFSFHKKNLNNNFIIFAAIFYWNNAILYFRNLKWKKLFSTIDNNFVSFNNLNIFEEIKLLNEAKKNLKFIRTKKDLLKFKYKGVKVGDLMYDTYLRFKNVPTININDKFLHEILAKLIFSFQKLDNLNSSYKIQNFFTNQLSYLHHGFPSRYFLSKKIKVKYFGGKASYLSDHKINNYWHSYDFRKFPSIFKKLPNKRKKISLAKKLLNDKFSGKIIPQENFILDKSAYNVKRKDKFKKFIGVIFLHCFVDAPTGRGKCLFNDFYEWVDETLNFFEKNNLSSQIAIKPHPNSRDASIETELKFKKRYKNFIWLDKKTSNKNIFLQKPKFGLSVLGSVLPEIAYHGIFCISASTHPSMAYNFVYRPKSQKEYFEKLLEVCKSKKLLKIKSREKIFEYIYCDYLKDDNKDLIAKKLKLKEWNFTKSIALSKFSKKICSFDI